MEKISRYFIISVFLLVFAGSASAQDTLNFPLNMRVGFDIANPVVSLIKKDISGYEGFVAIDLNEKMAAVIEGGYLDFKYSQYNYNYFSKGTFFRIGVDFNSMQPKQALGKYYAGIGLRYGFTVFNQEVKGFVYENYWGSKSTDINSKNYSAHYIEVLPGIRTEVFKNFSMGWCIRLRMLVYSSTGKDLRPLFLPGFGNGSKSFSEGFNYYLIWQIPYKNRTVITKVPVPVNLVE
jgi:hypothetical protein